MMFQNKKIAMVKMVKVMKEIVVTIIIGNVVATGFPIPSALLTLTMDTTYRKNVFNKTYFNRRDFIESWKLLIFPLH